MAAVSKQNRQAARSQAARANIVGAALDVFSSRGYAVAGMDEVCVRAGVSKGGLYHHFPSKRALLGAVAEHLTSAGAFRGLAGTDVGLTPESEARIVLEIWAEAARDEDLRRQLSDASAHPAEALSAILHAGLIVRRAAHAATPAEPHEAAA